MSIVPAPQQTVSDTADFLARLAPTDVHAEVVYDGPRPDSGGALSRVGTRYINACYVYMFLRERWPMYVGMSNTPADRFSAHSRKPWFPVSNEFILIRLRSGELPVANSYEARVEAMRASRAAATMIESQAIRLFRPSHNIAGIGVI